MYCFCALQRLHLARICGKACSSCDFCGVRRITTRLMVNKFRLRFRAVVASELLVQRCSVSAEVWWIRSVSSVRSNDPRLQLTRKRVSTLPPDEVRWSLVDRQTCTQESRQSWCLVCVVSERRARFTTSHARRFIF